MFLPNHCEMERNYVKPKFLDVESTKIFFEMMEQALKVYSRDNVLSNGILISDKFSNFAKQSYWELDISFISKFSDILTVEYGKYVSEQEFNSFFKTHHVRMVVSKYGQNQACDLTVIDSLIDNLSDWFDFKKCYKLFVSFAKNYDVQNNEEKTSILFNKESIENLIGQKVDFYGKAFAQNVGNFQFNGKPKSFERDIERFVSFMEDALPPSSAQWFMFHGVQGYSSLKSIYRRRSWEEPFFGGEITKGLCIPLSNASAKEAKKVQSVYATKEFLEAQGKRNLIIDKIEMSCEKNQEARIEVCISVDVDSFLKYKESSKALLNTLFELCNFWIDSNFDFSKETAIETLCVFRNSCYPTILHFLCTYIESNINVLIERHKSKGSLDLAELELVCLLERLSQYMFSGSPKKLPVLLLRELGCLNALNQRSFPFFYPQLLNLSR